MLLSELIQKRVYSGNAFKGYCVGIAVSLKTQAVKYLLCSSSNHPFSDQVDFCVNFSAVSGIHTDIHLTRVRPVFPKNCAKVFLNKPVFNDAGSYVGTICDGSLNEFTLEKLFCDNGNSFSLSSVAAFSDAVILKKEAPYPLGQRIPAPLLSRFNGQNGSIVTKSTLRAAMENKSLIRLTLSLAPFHHALNK